MSPQERELLIRKAEGHLQSLIETEQELLVGMNESDRELAQKRLHRFSDALHKISMRISAAQWHHHREAQLRNKQ